jgi:hypothetical protein
LRRLPAVRLPRTAGGWAAVVVFSAGVAIRVAGLALYRPALLGIPDSGTYINAAHSQLLLDPVHPAGYALFLRLVHGLDAHLTATIALQHLLGVATAGIFFWLVRERTGSSLLGLIPATVLLFNGLTLLTEHAPLSEPLFGFLVAASLLATAWAAERSGWWAPAAGGLIAAATLVRTVGLLLVAVAIVYLAVAGGAPLRRRLARAGACAGVALALIAGYVGVQRAHSGVTGLTESDGRIAYAVAAPFADCSRFTPPPGTRGLCQNAAQRHGSSNQYLWGYPDRGPIPAAGRAAVSPAWRLFGPMPGGDGKLAAFAQAAILAQPGDYLSQAWANFGCAWGCDLHPFIAAALTPDPNVERAVTSYYATGAGRYAPGAALIAGYARTIELDGTLYAILLLASLSALAIREPLTRRLAWLNLAAGWLLLAGSAAVVADPRYALPSLGPLATAAALGLAGPLGWLRGAASRRPSAADGARSSPRTWRRRKSA